MKKPRYLFSFIKRGVAPVYLKPSTDAPVFTKLAPGSTVLVQSVEKQFLEVRIDEKIVGWLHFGDAKEFLQALRHFFVPQRAGPLLNAKTLERVFGVLTGADEISAAKTLLQLSNPLQELLDAAPYVGATDSLELRQFESLMYSFLKQQNLPDRPDEFGSESWRRYARSSQTTPANLPLINLKPILPGYSLFDCLINVGQIGRIARSIFRAAMQIFRSDPRASDDFLWGGLAFVGQTVRSLEPLESLAFIAADLKAPAEVRTRRLEHARKALLIAAGPNAERQPISSGNIKTEGGLLVFSLFDRFPGELRSPTLPCRVNQWLETERAITCCGELYRIASVEFEEQNFLRDVYDDEGDVIGQEHIPNAGCIGKVIRIRGDGFSTRQIIDLDPGDDSELGFGILPDQGRHRFNSVSFLGPNGIRVFPDDSDYVSWSDNLIEVKVPPGAVSGEVEVTVLCSTNWTNRPVNVSTCGFQQKLPRHRPEAALVELRSASFDDLSIGSTSLISNSRLEFEACLPVTVVIRVNNTDSVAITDSDGANVAFPEGSPGEVRTVQGEIVLDERDSKTYFVSARNRSCGDAPPIEFTVVRYLAVHIEAAISEPFLAGASLSAVARISCSPSQLGIPGVDVRLRTRPSYGAVSFDPETIELRGNQDRARFTMDTALVACGVLQIVGDADQHRRGISGSIRVTPVAVPSRFSGEAIVRITGIAAGRKQTSARIDMTFGADRTSVVIAAIDFDPISVGGYDIEIRFIGGGTGTYDCRSGEISIPLVLELVAPALFPNSTLRFNFTTGVAIASGGLNDVQGAPLNLGDGAATMVGAGIFEGGPFVVDGESYTLVMSGSFSPIPPACCL